jgi:hypothetical protein
VVPRGGFLHLVLSWRKGKGGEGSVVGVEEGHAEDKVKEGRTTQGRCGTAARLARVPVAVHPRRKAKEDGVHQRKGIELEESGPVREGEEGPGKEEEMGWKGGPPGGFSWVGVGWAGPVKLGLFFFPFLFCFLISFYLFLLFSNSFLKILEEGNIWSFESLKNIEADLKLVFQHIQNNNFGFIIIRKIR